MKGPALQQEPTRAQLVSTEAVKAELPWVGLSAALRGDQRAQPSSCSELSRMGTLTQCLGMAGSFQSQQ